jgi:hypothetical protein
MPTHPTRPVILTGDRTTGPAAPRPLRRLAAQSRRAAALPPAVPAVGRRAGTDRQCPRPGKSAASGSRRRHRSGCRPEGAVPARRAGRRGVEAAARRRTPWDRRANPGAAGGVGTRPRYGAGHPSNRNRSGTSRNRGHASRGSCRPGPVHAGVAAPFQVHQTPQCGVNPANCGHPSCRGGVPSLDLTPSDHHVPAKFTNEEA